MAPLFYTQVSKCTNEKLFSCNVTCLLLTAITLQFCWVEISKFQSWTKIFTESFWQWPTLFHVSLFTLYVQRFQALEDKTLALALMVNVVLKSLNGQGFVSIRNQVSGVIFPPSFGVVQLLFHRKPTLAQKIEGHIYLWRILQFYLQITNDKFAISAWKS